MSCVVGKKSWVVGKVVGKVVGRKMRKKPSGRLKCQDVCNVFDGNF